METTDVRLFAASPSDVREEREQLAEVVKELNQTLGPNTGYRLELVRWETHVHPSMGPIQPNINRQIGDYDILVGIMWNRFGTPTETDESGTEQEFREAYERWRNEGKPQIMFYFCRAPANLDSAEEAEQRLKVIRFRDEISEKGLTWSYEDRAKFADVVRPHLAQLLNRMLSEKQVRALSDRREEHDANRAEYNAAFHALFEAARKTKAHLNQVKKKVQSQPEAELTEDFTDADLEGLWRTASERLSAIGEFDLARRSMVKSFGWSDGALWSDPSFMAMPIDVDVVLKEGLSRWGLTPSS